MKSTALRHALGIIVLALPGALSAAESPDPSDIRSVGSRVQLFCDHWLIQELKGAPLRLHNPAPREVAIRFDAPWERGEGGYGTIIHDAQYRLYYSAGGELDREYTCVAFSDDAITWKRPDLGRFEFEGSKANNIVWTGERKAYDESHNFSPFIDTNPSAAPEQRYKAVSLRVSKSPMGERQAWLYGYVSPDGIRWKRLQDEPIMTQGSFDSHNVVFWDRGRGEYVCYLR